MKFQMPFNSRVQIRLFERVQTPDSECHRVFEIFGLEDLDGDVDAITAGFASRFNRTRSVSDIKKDVDKANEPVPTTPSPDKTDVAKASN